MPPQIIPDNPNFCFTPAYDVETEVQQIRIVIEGLAGHVPTALISLRLDDALSICDKLNRPARPGPGGLDRHGRRLHARRNARTRRPLRALTRPAGLSAYSETTIVRSRRYHAEASRMDRVRARRI